MSSENLHAPRDRLTVATVTHHQAITSLIEELEAVDWYRQRADDCDDSALKEILLHNMREEMEHACMVLEWLRRSTPDWQAQLSTYLFSEGPILEVEEVATDAAGGDAGDASGDAKTKTAGGFTVGSLRGRGE